MMRRIPKNSYLPTVMSAVAILFSLLFINTTVVAQIYNSTTGMIEHTITQIGAGTFTVPDDVTQVTVEVWGAGGGGGGRRSALRDPGSGGGGGGYVKAGFIDVVPGSSYSFDIGAGGSAGTGSNDGSNGSSSTFTVAPTIILEAGGGEGGKANGEGVGLGGSALGGTTNISGSNGSGSNGGATGLENGNYGKGGNGSTGGGLNTTGSKGGDGLIRISYVPAYRAELVNLNVGSSIWEINEENRFNYS